MKLPLRESPLNHLAEDLLVSYMHEMTTGQSVVRNRDICIYAIVSNKERPNRIKEEHLKCYKLGVKLVNLLQSLSRCNTIK